MVYNPNAKPRNLDGHNGKRRKQRKRRMIFGTWNVQGISTKQSEVFQQLQKHNVDVCVLSETKKKGFGIEEKHGFIHIYSGVPKEKRARAGVSVVIRGKYRKYIKDWEYVDERLLTMDIKIFGRSIVIVAVYAPTDDSALEIKDKFETTLTDVISKIGNRKEIILMGDFNGRTGAKQNDNVIGQYGEGNVNDNGIRITGICESYDLRVLNGFYKHKDIHKYTWHQSTRQLRSIIDYIIVKQKTSLKISDTRVYRGAECGSDHFLLKAIVYFSRIDTNNQTECENSNSTKIDCPVYNTKMLEDSSISFLFKLRLAGKMRYKIEGTANEKYEWLERVIHEAAYEALGEVEVGKKHRGNEWINEELREIIEEKKVLYQKWLCSRDPEDRRTYVRSRAEVKKQASQAKNEMWLKVCEEIENMIGSGSRSRKAWKVINRTRQGMQERCNLSLIKADEWKEYFQDLMQEHRDQYKQSINLGQQVSGDIEDITIDEIRNSLRNMKNNKAPGPGGIPIELIKHSPIQVIEVLKEIFNDCIYGKSAVPSKWKYAWIVPLYKKGDRKKCNNYRGISVTSSVGRLYGRLLKARIEREWTDIEEQSGFRAGRSCTDNVFCLRNLIEKRHARNLETHLIFVDLQKAYDSVPRQNLIKVLEKTLINGHYVEAVKHLYLNNRSAVKLKKEISAEFQTSKGLLQGCCLSPTLFKIYISYALQEWTKKCSQMGIQIDDSYLYTLLFADDQVIIAADTDDASYMTRKLEEEFNKWGLEINFGKTEYLVIGAEGENLDINGRNVKNCNEFRYLGSIFSKDPNCEKDITHKINQGRNAINQLNGLWWSKGIQRDTKKRIYRTIVEGITLYNSETWDMNRRNERRLQAVEMDAMRRSCGVSRLEHIPNTNIKDRMNMEGDIVDRIEGKRLTWYGHLKRMSENRWPIKIWNWTPSERHRRRGRPRRTWKEGVTEAMESRQLGEDDVLDRRKWRIGCGKRRTL